MDVEGDSNFEPPDRVFPLSPRQMKQPTAIVYLFELRITSVSKVEKLPNVRRSTHSYTTYNIALCQHVHQLREGNDECEHETEEEI